MELLFFDTSALVKRYYEETGTDEVDELIEDDREVMISSLSVIDGLCVQAEGEYRRTLGG